MFYEFNLSFILRFTCFRVVEKIEEKNPEQVNEFKTNMTKVMKDLLSRFKDLQFFTGKYW